jgi:hypothetical protein
MPLALEPETLFNLGGRLALAGWLALAASPYRSRWAAGARWFAGRLVPCVLAAAYVAIFATTGMAGGGFDSLAAVQRLFAIPALLTAGWLHFLAFDLFVGAWIAERAGALGMPHLLILPVLLATFLFGPAGLLAFVVLRAAWQGVRRRATAIEGVETP